jgi:opacity protein-like surface antigen
MKRTLLLLATIVTLLTTANASFPTLAYRGFSGGMMLHAGWVDRGSLTIGGVSQRLSGLPVGIGGALRLRFGNHLRVGTEGYTSSLGYGDWGSSLSIGWGGLLVDWCWKLGPFAPYVGATVGGGSVEHTTLTTTPELDTTPEEGLSYRKYGVGVVAPFVGADYPLSERMSLSFKVDWLLPMGRNEFDFPSGARCYIGFMFNH